MKSYHIIEKPIVIIDKHIPYIKGALEPFAKVLYQQGNAFEKADVKKAAALIVRTRTKCNPDLLEGSSVRMVASATIGFDHIDRSYLKDKGIKWTNAPGCNSGSVEQYIAAALTLICKKEKVNPSKLTLGIVGVGHVGTKVAKMARAMGCKVLLNDPPRARKEGDDKFVSLSRIARKCDVITFHVPLNRSGQDKTLHLFNEKFLKKLERKPYIINSSRGEVANTHALILGAEKQLVRGLVLDVWENEPKIDKKLVGLCMLATPHIAGYSADGKANGTAMSVQAVGKELGFTTDGWRPTTIPMVNEASIRINCDKHTISEAIRKAVLKTYDIKADSDALKAEIGKFEWFRNNYPVRREFMNYSVVLKNAKPEVVKIFKKLGFALG